MDDSGKHELLPERDSDILQSPDEREMSQAAEDAAFEFSSQQNIKLTLASLLIKDAIHGIKPPTGPDGQEGFFDYFMESKKSATKAPAPFRLSCYKWRHSSIFQTFFMFSQIGLVMLPFAFELLGGKIDNQDEFLGFMVLLVDFLFIFTQAMDIFFLVFIHTFSDIWKSHKWTVARMITLMVVACGLPGWMWPTWPRTLWAFRPLVVIGASIYSRATFEAILHSVWGFTDVLLLVFTFLVIMAFIFFILMGSEANGQFTDLTDSLWYCSLMMFSIAEQVSFMNPLIADSEQLYNAIFFMLFTVVGCVFLSKLIVAAAMKSFKTRMKSLYCGLLESRYIAAKSAFHVLARQENPTDEPMLAKHLFIDLLGRVDPIIGDNAACVYTSLTKNDPSKKHEMDFLSFSGVFWVLDQNWTLARNPRDWIHVLYYAHNNAVRPQTTVVARVSAILMFFRKLLYEVATAHVQILGQEMVLLDFAMFFLTGWYIFWSEEHWVLSIFWAEIICKMYAFGPQNYFFSSLNLLDFVTMTLSTVSHYLADDTSSVAFLFFLVIAARLIRLTVLFLNLFTFTRETSTIIARTFPFLGEFAIIYFGGIYFFAMVFQDIYGRMLLNCVLRADDPTMLPCDPLLESTSWWSTSPMYNWETFTSSFVAMFYTTRTQGWPGQMKAPYVFGESDKNAAKFWFFTYRLIMVLVMQPFGLAMIVALWKCFSHNPKQSSAKRLGDFEVQGRNNKIHILRKLYGEAELRKFEKRRPKKSHENLDSEDHELFFYEECVQARKKELREVETRIEQLYEDLARM